MAHLLLGSCKRWTIRHTYGTRFRLAERLIFGPAATVQCALPCNYRPKLGVSWSNSGNLAGKVNSVIRVYEAGDGNRTHPQILGSVDSIICLVLG